MTQAHETNEMDGPHEGPIKTPKQLVLAVLYAFVVPIFGIILLVAAFFVRLAASFIKTDSGRPVGGIVKIASLGLAVVGVNGFLTTWNAFLHPLVLTTSESMRTLPVGLALFAQSEHSVDWGALLAGSTVATIPVLLAFAILSWPATPKTRRSLRTRTRISWAETSEAEPITSSSFSCVRFCLSIRIGRRRKASTSARRRLHQEAACMACAATLPRSASSPFR